MQGVGFNIDGDIYGLLRDYMGTIWGLFRGYIGDMEAIIQGFRGLGSFGSNSGCRVEGF